MANNVRSLVVELAASTAKFQADLGRAVAESNRQAAEIKRIFGGVATAIAGSFGVSFFVGLVKGSIDAADHLNDLSQKAQVSATELGGIGFAAAQSGSNLDDVSEAMVKLNKSVASAASGNKDMVAAFGAVGISVTDASRQTKSADVVFKELADKFKSYADGPEKAALAIKFFGRAGADVIPLLNEGSASIQKNIDYYKKYSGVTDDLVKKSDQFNDTLEKVSLISGALGKNLAAILLPVMQKLADEFLILKEGSDGTLASLNRWAAYKFNAGDAATQLKNVSNLIDQVNERIRQETGSQRGIFANDNHINSLKEQLSDLEKQKKYLKEVQVQEALNKAARLDTSDTELYRFRKKEKVEAAPRLSGGGSSSTADDPAKKYLDNLLKDLDRGNAEQASLLSARNKMLEQYNGDNLLSFADYYAARKAVASEALQAQLANYDAEITALKDYQARAAKATDKAEAQGKINDLVDKKAKLQTDAAQDSITQLLKESKAYDDLATKVRAVTADLLELQGQTAGSAKIRIDDQFGDLTKRLSANGDTQSLGILQSLKDLKVAQAEFNDLGEKGSKVFGDLQQAEERAYISQQIGATGELATMQQIGVARKESIKQLNHIVDAQQRIAIESGNPVLIENAQKAQLALDRLKASAAITANRITSIFENNFSDNFAQFIQGTKSASDAFKSFAQSVVNSLIQIAAQEVATSIFGGAKDGSGSVGSFFTDIFGGGKATGGPVFDGKAYLVGEKGPELFVPGMSGNIVPNHVLGKSAGNSAPVITINQTTHIDSRSDRQDIMAGIAASNERVKGEILESINRGGAFARQ